MAAKRNQALRLFVSGRRAGSLADRIGQVVARTDIAAQRAAATTARRAVPIAKRRVAEAFNVRAADLNGRVRAAVTGAKNRADTLRLYAHNRRLPLLLFGGAWGGRATPGATATIVRGKTEVFAGSFIARVGKSRLKGIRVRKWLGGKRAPRGPLQMLYGPSPRDMITGLRSDAETRTPSGRYGTQVDRTIAAELVDIYAAELARQLSLVKPRG